MATAGEFKLQFSNKTRNKVFVQLFDSKGQRVQDFDLWEHRDSQHLIMNSGDYVYLGTGDRFSYMIEIHKEDRSRVRYGYPVIPAKLTIRRTGSNQITASTLLFNLTVNIDGDVTIINNESIPN